MRPSALTHAEFIARFGAVYEASPWVAEGVWSRVEAGLLDDRDTLAKAMREEVDAAPRELQLELLRAHPQLASRAKMADASVKEQAGAGLDQCTREELDAFQRLNAAYDLCFGFPFIVAVKDKTRAAILADFERRLGNDAEAEFATALEEVHRIAGFRLAELFGA